MLCLHVGLLSNEISEHFIVLEQIFFSSSLSEDDWFGIDGLNIIFVIVTFYKFMHCFTHSAQSWWETQCQKTLFTPFSYVAVKYLFSDLCSEENSFTYLLIY